MREDARRAAVRATIVGGGITVVGVLPMFLTGSMAVQITEDLGFGATGLGLAIGIFRGTGALSAVFTGRLVDRLGGVWSVRLAATIAIVVALGIGLWARSWWQLVVWLMIGSAANTIAQPAANRMLVNRVPPERQGLAFGVKQSAPPVATLLAGLSVPLVATTVGWRWAFSLAVILALVVAAGAGRPAPRSAPLRRSDGPRQPLDGRRTLILLAASFGIGTAASSTIPVFYVDAAVDAGSSSSLAGTMLAVASIAAILVRLCGGLAADRMVNGHLRLCAVLLLSGATGLLLLATGDVTLMALGAIVGLAGTWGFNGIFFYAVVRSRPKRPGSVTGVIMPGALTGTSVGPMAFGVIAGATGYSTAWLAAVLVAIAGAAAMLLAARMLGNQEPASG